MLLLIREQQQHIDNAPITPQANRVPISPFDYCLVNVTEFAEQELTLAAHRFTIGIVQAPRVIVCCLLNLKNALD